MTEPSKLVSIVLILDGTGYDGFQTLTEFKEASALTHLSLQFIVVDNGSSDSTSTSLAEIVDSGEFSNLTVLVLSRHTPIDRAAWIGVQNALGDFVLVVDPKQGSAKLLPAMLQMAHEGNDVVLTNPENDAAAGLTYRVSFRIFRRLFRTFSGSEDIRSAPMFRLISRRVLMLIHQHPDPELAFMILPLTGGFKQGIISYNQGATGQRKTVRAALIKGLRLLTGSSEYPLRLVTIFSLVSALASLVYSVYVLGIAVTKDDVAEGWVSISLQQSGSFFMISLTLFLLSEYLLHATNSFRNPISFVARELSTASRVVDQSLNIEEPLSAKIRETSVKQNAID